MRWTPGNRGSIDDMRGRSGVGIGGAGLGIGGVLVLLLLSWFTGVDFLSLVGAGGSGPPVETVGTSGSVATSPEEEHMVDMVGAVLDDTQKTCRELLGGKYQETRSVLFRDAIQSA
jgi:predicted metalloprotease